MFDTNAVKESFGRAAADYDAHAELQHAVRAHCIKLAAPFWPKDSHILDAGCGTGAFFPAGEKCGWRSVGLDIAPGMCQVAREHMVPVINAGVEQIPLADESFDGVFSSLMLQWANDPQAVFSEMARVLKPRRHAVLSTFVHGTLTELETAFQTVDDARHVSPFLEPHQLLEAAREGGFTLTLARQVKITEFYPDIIALMRRLQAIGATNRHSDRRKGMMTSRQFAKLERAYLATPRGLPASWQTLYLVLQKT